MDIDGLEETIDLLDTKGQDVCDALYGALEEMCQRIETTAVMLAPVDMGGLRESITSKVERTENVYTGIIHADVYYAIYVEFGTGVIGQDSPKDIPDGLNLSYTQNAWVYYDEKTGKYVYTKGQPAQPFLYPAYFKHKNKLPEIIKVKLAEKGIT